MKLLTIGNSFADNATEFLSDMFAADGSEALTLGKANLGGTFVQKHWNLHLQSERFPHLKPYQFLLTGCEPRDSSLSKAISAEPWDYVTLQQSSDLSIDPATFFPWIGLLHGLVRELAPQAEILIHQTWSYREDSGIYRENGLSSARMFELLAGNYREAGARLGCRVIPCGLAFQKARERSPYELDPSYDFSAPEPLTLPIQTNTLQQGYCWDTGNTASGNPEFRLDCRHCNVRGIYLANAVWFEFLTGRTLAGNTFLPPELDPADRDLLRQCASDAVAEGGS
ncbi:MAG: DUF4886 domain-containing protein [Verrucomicrobiae bacterium]